MPDQHQQTNTPIHALKRRQGKRMSKEERQAAQHSFLDGYKLNGNIMLSCKKANINRSSFYQWLEHDQSFSIQYHQAEKDFADFALAEFRKRAMEGYEKPVISMGRMVYEEIPLLNKDGTPQLDSKGKPMVKHGKPLMERVVSDTLLAMLIKKHFPEYREKSSVDLNATVQGNLTHGLNIDTRGMSPEGLREMKEWAAREKARQEERKSG